MKSHKQSLALASSIKSLRQLRRFVFGRFKRNAFALFQNYCELSSEIFYGANTAERTVIADVTNDVMVRLGLTSDEFAKGLETNFII